MQNDERKIKAELSSAEYKFVEWVRTVKWGECTVMIKHGQPVQALRTIESIKFTLDKEL